VFQIPRTWCSDDGPATLLSNGLFDGTSFPGSLGLARMHFVRDSAEASNSANDNLDNNTPDHNDLTYARTGCHIVGYSLASVPEN
jgi:hypothetical protein